MYQFIHISNLLIGPDLPDGQMKYQFQQNSLSLSTLLLSFSLSERDVAHAEWFHNQVGRCWTRNVDIH